MLNTDRLCPGCMKDNSGESICSVCGYDSKKGNPPDKLPARFIIRDRYFVGKVLYSDLSSTVYLGFDMIENKTVNIKEYFPSLIAQRNPDKTVFVVKDNQFVFNEGIMEFIEINKKLISFPLSSLPATYAVFEENSTAYAICEAVTGISLKSFLKRNGGFLRWEQVRPLVLPLIDTIKALHDISIIHGAISPDTVIVCRDGKLRLTGIPINTVKRKMRDCEVSLGAQLYDGYSAAEQYGITDNDIGKYTDVYGICATIFTALIGTVPPPADERIKADSLRVPSHFADELPRQVLVSIANGMQVKPEVRTQDIETLKNELIYGETKENVRKSQRAAAKNNTATKTPTDEGKQKSSGLKYAAIASGITAGLFVIMAVVLIFTVFKDQIFKKDINGNNSVPSMPETASIGDIDSDAVESKVLYPVPDLRGKLYSEIADSDECKHLKVVIKTKEYSSEYERGQICAQSIQAGESAEHGALLELTISLGSMEFRMPDISGLSEEQAVIELLKLGLLYDNIDITDEFDSESKPAIVLRQEPARGETITAESKVIVFVNSYKGDNNSGNN